MPRIVTASHPSEAALLNLAAGRPGEGLEECRKHLAEGCRLCDVRLAELADLVESVREEVAFDDILEGNDLPALPDFGNTVAFQPRVPQLEEIYRLAESAEGLAEGLVAAARESDAKLDEALRALYGNPARGFALLYACQKGNTLVAQDPLRALELARAVFEEAKSLMDANTETRLATPAPRETVQAEAKLLESNAQTQLGYAMDARVAAAEAREFFRAAGDVGFGLALADYYEGSAAGFGRDYIAGERLLKKALKVFAEFGQDNLIGRAEAALGTLIMQRGDDNRALLYYEHAIEVFDPVEDGKQLASTLNNRAGSLMRLKRFEEARSSYARALSLARKLNAQAVVQNVRNGLAELEFQRGRYERAIRAFSDLASVARKASWKMEQLFAELYVAECLGRLGREEEMAEMITSLRIERKANPFAPSPAMEELFDCLDRGILDADLVAHVRRYLQDEANGVQRAYEPLRLAS
jgi:tetratricopeptide (TPR) repeat protein